MSRTNSNSKVRTGEIAPQPPLARACQFLIFIIVLMALVFAPLAFGAVRLWALGPVLVAAWVGTALWVVRIVVVRKVPVVFSALGAPMLLGTTFVIVRYGLADVEALARFDLFTAIASALVFFLVLNNVRHRWQITALLWTWVGLGTLIALYGITQVVGLFDGVWWFPQYEKYRGQASGTFINPAHYTAYLQMLVPLAAANFLFSRRGYTQKVGLFFACLVMSAGLLLSFSSGMWLGWLASLIVLAVYVIRRRGTKFRWAVIGGSVLGAVIVLTLVGLQIVREHTPGLRTDWAEDPLPLWRSAIAVGRQSPFLGSGPAMFRWQYPAYRSLQQQPTDANSEYLNLFAEYGLIGCLLILWVVAAFGISTVRILLQRASRYSAATPSNRFAFAIGGLAALAAVIVNSIFASSLHAPANTLTLVAIIAAVLTCGVHQHGEDDENSERAGQYAPVRLPRMGQFVLAAALVAALVLFTPQLRHMLEGDFWLRRAERARGELDWTTAARDYTRAWQADHRSYEIAAGAGDYYAARATWNKPQRATLANEALRWYERAFSINPYAYDVLIKTGKLYDSIGMQQLAAERFQRALQFDPRNASYHRELGYHYVRWGDRDEALNSFDEADRLAAPKNTGNLQFGHPQIEVPDI